MDVHDNYQTTYDSKTQIVVFYSLIVLIGHGESQQADQMIIL